MAAQLAAGRLRRRHALHAARYNPWDQRLCLVPDGDLVQAISRRARLGRHRHGSTASPSGGIRARSPATSCEADIVVIATGLNLLLRSAASQLTRRRRATRPRRATMTYKGMMLSGVPNLAFCVRLHERVVDAEGRPHRRVRRAGCSRHMDRAAATIVVRAARSVGRQRSRSSASPPGLRPARERDPAQAGHARALARAPELSVQGHAGAALRPHRRRRPALRRSPAARP